MQYSQEFKSNSEENKYTPEKSKIFHAEEINNDLMDFNKKLILNYIKYINRKIFRQLCSR